MSPDEPLIFRKMIKRNIGQAKTWESTMKIVMASTIIGEYFNPILTESQAYAF